MQGPVWIPDFVLPAGFTYNQLHSNCHTGVGTWI